MLASLPLSVLFSDILLGVLAGALTTVAGMGGGMLLLLALAALGDPHQALAATAPALLIGNLHRVWIGRQHIDRDTARPLVIGAFPGALLGGAFVAAIPQRAVAVLMLAMTGLALARSFGLKFSLPARAGLPVGLLSGALTATSGGAAILLAPFLRARELSGPRYVATTAVTAVAIHLARVLAYGMSGMSDASTLIPGAVLAVSIAVGNVAGDAAGQRLAERTRSHIQDVVMVTCTALALIGVT